MNRSTQKAARAILDSADRTDEMKARLVDCLRNEVFGTSEATVARQIGVSRQYVHDIISGRREVSLKVAGKIAGAVP